MKTFEFDLTFNASDLDRSDFLRDLMHCFLALIHNLPQSNGLTMLFQEILKNIHDHAEGQGYLRICKRAGELEFEIKDFGENSYDWVALAPDGISSKKGNQVNYGIGLQIIQDIAKGLHIDLQTDTSRGFCYKGIYQFPSPSK